MTKIVQETARFDEPHYFKGFGRDTDKLAEAIHKLHTQLAYEELSIEGYAIGCNAHFNHFIGKLGKIYPEPFLKKIYQDHYPLEEVQRAIQDKMEYLKHSRDNLELRENAFEKEVININKDFLKILMGKKA